MYRTLYSRFCNNHSNCMHAGLILLARLMFFSLADFTLHLINHIYLYFYIQNNSILRQLFIAGFKYMLYQIKVIDLIIYLVYSGKGYINFKLLLFLF